ncbi:MAG: rod shape-determining protein [Candidatus Delongbacteria bacterium]|jgi:cell division protein FtsA|nr:rod shape-determining protein [Candidatus Delongbacteria bacterium]
MLKFHNTIGNSHIELTPQIQKRLKIRPKSSQINHFQQPTTNKLTCQAIVCKGKQAEALKLQYGNVMKELIPEQDKIIIQGTNDNKQAEIYLDDLYKIIQMPTKEIINVILLSCKDANIVNSLQHGIVITGGAAKLKHLDLLIKDMTGCEVRIGLPRCNDNNKEFDRLNDPSYATAIGLLQYQ